MCISFATLTLLLLNHAGGNKLLLDPPPFVRFMLLQLNTNKRNRYYLKVRSVSFVCITACCPSFGSQVISLSCGSLCCELGVPMLLPFVHSLVTVMLSMHSALRRPVPRLFSSYPRGMFLMSVHWILHTWPKKDFFFFS